MESEQTYARPPKKRMTVEMLEALTQSDNNSTEANIKDTQSPEPPSTNDTICAIDNEGAIGKRSAKKTSGEKAPKRRKRHSKNVDLDNVIVDMEQNAESIPESDRQYRCNLCANDFVFPKRCATHMLNTHDITEAEIMENITIGRKEVGPKSCDICGYVTKDQNYYYIHYHKYFRHGVPLPKGWKPFKCDICGKECFTKFQLKDHKLIHKEENPFMCETCGQGFKSRTCLNSHVFHRHNNERKHNCADCVKTFKTRTQLLVHRRIHTGEKPYHCPDCTYKSTTRGNMRLHLTNRHKYSNDTIKTLMYEMKTSAFTPSDDIPVEIKSVKGKSEPVGSTGVSEYPVTGCTVGVIDYNGQTSEPETPTANLERAVRMALAQGNQAVEGQLPNLDTISTSTTTTTTKPDDRIYGAQVPVDSNELHCTGQIFENLANPAMVPGNSQSNDIESNMQTGVLNTDSGNIAIQVAIIGDSGQLEASNINMEQFSNIQTYDPNQLQTVQNIVPSQALLQQLQQQLNQSGQVNQQPQLQIVHLQTPQQLQEAFRTLNQTDSNSLSQQIQQQITSPVQQQQQQTVQYQIKNLSPSAQAQNSTNAQHIVVSPETSEIPEDQGTLEEETYVSTSDITSTLSSLPTVITVAAQENSEQTNDESEQQNYDNAASMPSNQYESNIMQQAYYHAFYPHGYQ